MILFPAIDIYNNKCVRLLYGDFEKITVYGDPVEMALKWQEQGAEFLHVVDLNGAKDGSIINHELIKTLISKVNIPVQLGGGIRNVKDVEYRLNVLNANRVIIGSGCLNNKQMVIDAFKKFGSEKIVCGVDAKNGKVAINGWADSVDVNPIDLCLELKKIGGKYVVFTDISRDGALTGVNTDACLNLAKMTGMQVIASGGVTSLNDIISFNDSSMYGIILGKAIYNGNFSVTEALKEINIG